MWEYFESSEKTYPKVGFVNLYQPISNGMCIKSIFSLAA